MYPARGNRTVLFLATRRRTGREEILNGEEDVIVGGQLADDMVDAIKQIARELTAIRKILEKGVNADGGHESGPRVLRGPRSSSQE